MQAPSPEPRQASGVSSVVLFSVIAFAIILAILALVVFLGSGDSMMEYEGFN
jgi:hypothetical protein